MSGTLTHGAVSSAVSTDFVGPWNTGGGGGARFRGQRARCIGRAGTRRAFPGPRARSIGTWSDRVSPEAPGWVAFRTWNGTRYARAARLGALPAWQMHLQVPNRTQSAVPVEMLNIERIRSWVPWPDREEGVAEPGGHRFTCADNHGDPTTESPGSMAGYVAEWDESRPTPRPSVAVRCLSGQTRRAGQAPTARTFVPGP